jgi:hypothetical protein
MYDGICPPPNPSGEFTLTDNCYNLFEGPNCFATDKPISPKLMIVLRSCVLAVPQEDVNPETKEGQDLWHFMALDTVNNWEVKSLLPDYPIVKARNNYSEIDNSRVQRVRRREAKKGLQILIKYFPIDLKHVRTINGGFLRNVYLCSRAVFGTRYSLSRPIETLLTVPTNIITGDNVGLHLRFLKNLAAVSATGNTITRGKYLLSTFLQNVLTKISSHIIKSERLAQLI